MARPTADGYSAYMRSFFPVFALLLPGCELEPCDAAIATVRACDLAVEDSMYPDLADTCPSECYSLCISAAACDELDPQLAEDRYEVGTPTDDCITECDGGTEDTWTPLVLAFGEGPVAFTSAGGTFDFGHGPIVTDWPTAGTPWLVLDRDESGTIDDATELFGDRTPLREGGTGPNGFIALAELDADHDDWVTPLDPGWAELSAWWDVDGDHVSDVGEVRPLPEGMELETRFTLDVRCDRRGNCQREVARLRYRDEAGREVGGRVIDVYLRGPRR